MLIDWSLITPDEFEHLCWNLLSRLGFVNCQWFKGPSDRGRDITAEKIVEPIPGVVQNEKWIVECKRYTKRTLAIEDLQRTISWADARDPNLDYLLIITTTTLRNDTIDLINERNRNKKFHYTIHVIESYMLVSLLQDTGLISDLKDAIVSGNLLQLHQKYYHELKAVWSAGDNINWKIQRANELFKKHSRDRNNPASMRVLGVIRLYEVHEICYLMSGYTHTTYRFKLCNISDTIQLTDAITVHGAIPVFQRQQLKLKGFDSLNKADLTDQIEFVLNTPKIKALQLHILGGIPPGRSYAYEIAMDWPYSPPLKNKLRYYVIPINSFIVRLTIRIQVPGESRPEHATLFRARPPWLEPIAELEPRRKGNTWAIEKVINFPSPGVAYQVFFTL